MTKTMPCFPKATHVNHLLGSCQQPKGFNGTVFWDLHMLSMFFERWRVSRGKGRRETSLSVKTLKEDTSSAKKMAAPIFLSFPAVTFRCKLILSASLPGISASGKAWYRPGCQVIEQPVLHLNTSSFSQTEHLL